MVPGDARDFDVTVAGGRAAVRVTRLTSGTAWVVAEATSGVAGRRARRVATALLAVVDADSSLAPVTSRAWSVTF